MRVPQQQAEPARALLLSLTPSGFEEVERADGLELTVYTDAAGEEAVRSVFGEVVSTAVEDGWEDRWRSFHRPVQAGGVWIGPPWETAPPGITDVVIDPGQAFGTGAHATTRACVELVAAQERGSVLDAGCGSGVLAVAAALLGFDPVVAADVDPAAVRATRAIAARNGVVVDVRQLDVLSDALPSVDLVVANIELVAVEALLPRCRAARAITSGYLAGQVPAHERWKVLETFELEGWAAHVLERFSQGL